MVDLKVGSNIIKKIGLVIFDKDGTLMDLYKYWSSMVAYRVDLVQARLKFSDDHKKDIMYAMGVDIANKRLRENGPVGLKKREIVMQTMEDALGKIGFRDIKDICHQVFEEADDVSMGHLEEIIRPINGMKTLINSLCERECRIAVATTDKTVRAKLAVQILGIADKIDIVVGEDMVKNYKPYPDMVYEILKSLGVDKESAVMVGDAVTDVEMGMNAGLRASIGVCSGLTARKELVAKTQYIVEDISCIKVI